MEEPWQKARAGIPENIRGNNEITKDTIEEYYSGLLPQS